MIPDGILLQRNRIRHRVRFVEELSGSSENLEVQGGPLGSAQRSEVRCFGGKQGIYRHFSDVLGCAMQWAVFTPPQAEVSRVPVLYFLSGLTCSEENFVIKAGAQREAAERGLMLIAPDTSPRGLGLPGEEDDWDLGTGAGFYLDATVSPWAEHYRMHSYVVEELPALCADRFPLDPELSLIHI